MQKILTIILIFFVLQTAQAQIVKYGNDFLSIGAGARAAALGNGTIASTEGAEAGFWNPANLQSINKLETVFTHDNYFSGLAIYDFLGVSYTIDTLSAVGFSLIRLGIDDIQNTLQLFDENGNMDFDRISYFSTADYAALFSYARKIPNFPSLSLGANVKLIYRHEGSFANAIGFGIDLAASWQHKKLKTGLVFRDITSTFNVWNVDKSKFDSSFVATGNSIPENSIEIVAPTMLFSVAREFKIYNFTIQPEGGANINFDGKRNYIIKSNFASINPFLACEFSYKKIVFLRGGVSDFQKNNNLFLSKKFSFVVSGGAGISFKRFSFDYTFLNTTKNSYDYQSNIFTLKLRFL